jgi:hypothetical protein
MGGIISKPACPVLGSATAQCNPNEPTATSVPVPAYGAQVMPASHCVFRITDHIRHSPISLDVVTCQRLKEMK